MQPENPYPRQKGFGLRLANARRAIRHKGMNWSADIYSRGFDNCFEMFDGEAVVWALMHRAINGDHFLKEGIERMGANVWPDWLKVYNQEKPVPQPTAEELQPCLAF